MRLAGDHRGLGMAHVHGVGVHDPRHGLLVGVHVRSGNVTLRAEQFEKLGRIATRNALQFAVR